MVVTCGKCGKKTPEGKLCQICGAYLAPPIACPGCKRTMAAGTEKCSYCGHQFVAVKPPDTVDCPKCGRKMPPHLPACLFCGSPLNKAPAATVPGGFQAVVEKAVQLCRAGQLKEALPLLEEALLVQPGNPDLWDLKGGCLHNLRRFDEALPCYERVLRNRPDDPQGLYHLGNTLRMLRRMPEAVAHYERAAALNPRNGDLIGNLALSLRWVGRYADAIPHCHNAMSLKGEGAGFFNCLGFCLLKQGQHAKALPYLQQAAAVENPDPEFVVDLGMCLEALGRAAEADACFEKAGGNGGMSGRANVHQAQLFERRGQLPDAAEHFFRACSLFIIEQRLGPLPAATEESCRKAREGLHRLLAHSPRAPEWRNAFARAIRAEAAGDFGLALSEYESASIFMSDNREAMEGVRRMLAARKGGPVAPQKSEAAALLARALENVSVGDAAAGLREVDQLLARNSSDPATLWQLKGRALVRLARPDEALAAYGRSIQIDPNFALPWAGTAEALAAKGDLDRALEALERALALDPHDPLSWTIKAGCLRKKGRAAEALECVDRVLQKDAASAPAWLLKAQTEDELGRVFGAQVSYRKFLALKPKHVPDEVARAEARLAQLTAAAKERSARFEKAAEAVLKGAVADGLPFLDEFLAIPDMPEKDSLWVLKGKGLLRLGREDEALACFDQAIAIAETNSSGWSGKAEAFEQKGDLDRAREFADQALARSETDAEALTVKGNCLRKEQKFSDALDCFERALRKDRENARARLLKAETEEALGRRADALITYAEFLALKPPMPGEAARAQGRITELLKEFSAAGCTDPKELAERGIALQNCGRLDDALAYYRRAAELFPNATGSWVGLATCHRERKEFDEAIRAIDRALALEPRADDVLLLKSFILSTAGRQEESQSVLARVGAADQVRDAVRLTQEKKLDEAMAKIEKVLAADPTHEEAWCAKAEVLQLLGKHGEAIACFERALQIKPDHFAAATGVGESLVHAERFKEAEPILRRCLEKNPRSAKSKFYLGHVLEKLGQKEAALEGYARFLWAAPDAMKDQIRFARQQHGLLLQTLSPKTPKPPSSPAGKHLEKASELIARGRVQEALLAYDDAIKLDPYGFVAWLNKGQCLLQLGRAEEAQKALEQGTKLAPKSAAAWIMRASALKALKRAEEALQSLEKAIQLDAYQSAAWGNKAATLNELKRPLEALPCLERALILDPANVVAWYNRGCTEADLGRKDDAKISLQRFLAIAPEGVEDQVESARRILARLETDRAEDNRDVIEISAKPKQVIGRYEIYKELGRGGMGVVYLALIRGTDDACALKTFLDEHAADARSVERFKKEAQTWINLDRHPNLVRAYYVDEVAGRLYIAMELIPPGHDGCNTLEGYLRLKPPGLNQILRWSIQFCHGMEYAVAKGIRCHRDIKPANIMIDARKNLKISDFGLAAAMPAKAGGSTLTLRGGNVGLSVGGEGGGAGTPTHMPPEQWKSAASCDERSDIYAFGVTLYQMASKGKLPFLPPHPRNTSLEEQRRFMREIAQMHFTAAPARLDSPLWPLIDRCLRKDPAQRYAKFRDLRADLEPLLRGQAQGETIAAPQIEKLGAWDLVDKGWSFDSLGRPEEAVRFFDEALKLDPNHAAALEGKATSLSGLGKIAEALACADRAIALAPKSRSAHETRAGVLHRAGRTVEALAGYEKAVECEPDNAVTWRNKGRCLNALDRLDDALKAFDRAIQLEPENALGWHDRSDVLRLQGRAAEAVEGFRKVLAMDPSFASAWNLLGESLGTLERYDEAIAAYDRAVAVDPSNYNAWVNRGACLVRAGRQAEGMASYDKAISVSPEPAMAWNNKGDLYVRMSQPDKAVECFERALAIQPGHALASQNMALRLRDLGKMDEGLAVLERGLKSNPDHSGLWYFKAEFLKAQGKVEPAVDAYQQVLRTEKANVRAVGMSLCHLGECCEKLGRIDDARAAFQQATQILPNYKEALEGFQRCQNSSQGAAQVDAFLREARQAIKGMDPNKAQQAYLRATELAPLRADVWAEFGEFLIMVQQVEQARQCYLFATMNTDMKSPELLFRQALVNDACGHPEEAFAGYQYLLTLKPPASFDKEVAFARQRVAEIKAGRAPASGPKEFLQALGQKILLSHHPPPRQA